MSQRKDSQNIAMNPQLRANLDDYCMNIRVKRTNCLDQVSFENPDIIDEILSCKHVVGRGSPDPPQNQKRIVHAPSSGVCGPHAADDDIFVISTIHADRFTKGLKEPGNPAKMLRSG